MTNLASAIFQNPVIDPNREAIRFEGRQISHRELRRRVNRFANALAAHGVRKGDRVSVLLSNRPELLESFYAIAALGALYVPLNTRLSAQEHITLLGDAAPVAFISSSAFAPTLDRAAADVPSIKYFILVDHAKDTQIDYDALLESGSDEAALLDAEDYDDAAIVYTSGTTSLPKGVVLTHGNYLSDWENVASVIKPTVDSVNLQLAPLYHAAIVHSLVHLQVGARTILAAKFDSGRVLQTIAEERVTHVFCVPTMIYDMLDHSNFATTDFSSLRTLEYGAAPMTRTRLEEASRTLGPTLVHGYGMTETTSHCCMLAGTEHNEALGSIGRPLPLCEMRIVDESGIELPAGEIGELVAKGANIMDRYWKRETETAVAIKDGWLHTGDIGRKSGDGYYYVVDRKKDMIISGGVNIYPKDIEEVIALHPAIAEVAVFGMPDPHWGESVAAAVRIRPGLTLDQNELLAMLEGRLGRYQLPKKIEIIDEFPRNGAGKIMKHVLRKAAVE